MNFNIFNSLILAGIIQGFIFAVVVLQSKKYRTKSTLILTGLIVTYSLGNLQYIVSDIGWISLTDMYKYLYLPLASIIPVLIYFYVFKFLHPNSTIKNKLGWCLIFIISLIITFYFRIQFILNLNDANEIVFSSFIKFVQIHEVVSVFYAIILVSLSIKKVFLFEKKKVEYNQSQIRTDVKWLKYTLYFILLFTFIWAHLTYRNIFVEGDSPNFYLLWIGIAATIYWLGHIGIYKYGIIKERKQIRKHLERHMMIYPDNSSSNINKNSGRGNKHIDAFKNLLEIEKIYLNPDLTLENVAQNLQLSPGYLSRIIHSELNTSFPDYINSYRIEEAKRYLTNLEFSKYTITSIGLEAGFNSRSSFYDVFKKQTGMTPLRFKKSN